MAKLKPRRIQKKIITPKSCYFCKEHKEPWFTDIETLKRFVSERGKIMGRARTGFCSKHQKRLTLAIKHARHLALMAFMARH